MKPHDVVVGCFKALARHAIGHPKRVLVLVSLVALAAAPGILRLKLRTDGHALVSPKAPEVIYDKGIRDKFGIQDQLVVLIHPHAPEGIFTAGTVQLVRDLTAELQALPGINPSNVMSLATEPSFRARSGSIFHQTMLEPPLRTKAELELLRDDLHRIELYTGTFVSADGKSTVILVGVPEEADRAEIYRRVLTIVEKAQRNRPETPDERAAADRSTAALPEITVTGAPVAESLLGLHILADLGLPTTWLGPTSQPTEPLRFPTRLNDMRLLLARRLGLVPVAALVMMLILLLCFRNLVAMLIPLPGVAATLIFVFGLMGWCGVPIYLTMAVMPVLLVATGVTNDIYLFTRYFSLLREKPGLNQHLLVGETFEKLASPVACTSLTTAIAFLSFAFSPLAPIRAFGIFTAVGVLFGLFYSLTVVPAMLTLLRSIWLLPRRRRIVEGAFPKLAAGFGKLGAAAVRRRWWMLALALGIVAATPLGLRRLVVQDSWTDAFDPESEFRRATQMVNEQFHGLHLLFVSFDVPATLSGDIQRTDITPEAINVRSGLPHPTLLAGSPITLWGGHDGETNNPSPVLLQSQIEMVYGFGGHIGTRIPHRIIPEETWQRITNATSARFEVAVHTHFRPEIIHAIGDLADFLRRQKQYAVGGVLSPADYIATTRFMAHPEDPGARALPNTPDEIRLMWDYYGIARGQQHLHQIVDTNYWESLTTVFLKDANFRATAALMKDMRAYEREQLAPKGIKLGFAGDVAVSQSLIGGIVTTQLHSLGWSLAGIFLVTALFGGSLRWGIYCMLPSALAVLIKFAVMGWTGIPLGVATSMFAAMTLGIGVNCSIQLLDSCRREENAATRLEAICRAMSLTGPPAFINTVAVSLGFGVLMLSQVPANARLGILVVLGLMNCFIASLVLLPALLEVWPLKKQPNATS